MAVRDKVITLALLWLTIVLSIVYAVENLWLRLILLGMAAGVTTHLLRIKNYRPERKPQPAGRLFEPEE